MSGCDLLVTGPQVNGLVGGSSWVSCSNCTGRTHLKDSCPIVAILATDPICAQAFFVLSFVEIL